MGQIGAAIFMWVIFMVAMHVGYDTAMSLMTVILWGMGALIVGIIGYRFYEDVTGKTEEMRQRVQRQAQVEREARRPNRDILK